MIKKNGFTLIELLVVMAIIGILAALSLTSFSTAQKNSRDTRRKSDLAQYRNALEAYASNNGGKYPNNTKNGASCIGDGIFREDGADPNGPLINEYLPTMIRDPINTCAVTVCDPSSGSHCSYYYYGVLDGISYTLHANLETGGHWQICSSGKAGKVSTWVAPGSGNCELP